MSVDVIIPAEKRDLVSGKLCEAWLVEHVRGSAIGHVEDGVFMVRFSDERDAQAFREGWLE